jgi:SAM-dependent methyltransferase
MIALEQEQARFVERAVCINCGSSCLDKLSIGHFGEEPVRGFLENDPWGVSPLPYIERDRWELVRCADCTQMFHRNILSPEWNERRFSEWMTETAMRQFLASRESPPALFDRGREHVAHITRIERLTRPLRNQEAVRILDFGCGWGEFLAACEDFGFICYGIDRSSARRKHGRIHILPSVEDLKDMPAAAHGFHAVTLFEVLEHLEDPLAVLRALHNLLVSRGILVLETPDCTGVSDFLTESDYRKIHPLDHINAFTPATLRNMAIRAGFEPVSAGVAHVTDNPARIAKTELRRLLRPFLRATTREYFLKVR